jgi:hypothetical protein
MPRVCNLADVLHLILDGLNKGAFAEEQRVPPPHEPIVPVLADFRPEREALDKERILQGVGKIAPVAKELPKQPLRERWYRLAVIDMAWGQTTGQECPLIIANPVELTAIKPAHGGLAACRPARQAPMGPEAAMVAHRQGRRVDKRHAGTASLAGVQIAAQGHKGAREQLHKTRITDVSTLFRTKNPTGF